VETIGERIRARRKAIGRKAYEVADAVGMSRSAYTELEKGDSKSSAKLHLIAAELGVDPAELDPPPRRRRTSDAERHPPVLVRQQDIDLNKKNKFHDSRLLRLDRVKLGQGYVTVKNFFEAASRGTVTFQVDKDLDLLADAYESLIMGDGALLHQINASVAARVKDRLGGMDGGQEAAAERPGRQRRRSTSRLHEL